MFDTNFCVLCQIENVRNTGETVCPPCRAEWESNGDEFKLDFHRWVAARLHTRIAELEARLRILVGSDNDPIIPF